ncbi:mitochondrial proteinase 1 [Coccidioides immitis H538.4]|uniref:Proteinase 1 n=3 Tax=Coccidioides immitis TaxID=5501 RepID=A0A0J8RAY6_COCIT|nr:proteinase 1 [Coccidioides immitis RMSCC 2394]KMU82006.1 proteinase 1 [Coccidioides immitis RMSCC 3703]KMU89121.1 mitochondrial proteinase 1 [Coccidioides immitis H538.4]
MARSRSRDGYQTTPTLKLPGEKEDVETATANTSMTSSLIGRLFRSGGKRGRLRASPFRLGLWVAGTFCAAKVFNEHAYELQLSSGPSMYPTIHFKGDYLLISKYYKYGRGIAVGDIVTFKHPSYVMMAAKRVVGMPGDYVLVDPEDHGGPLAKMIQVPEGHIMVTGDNLPWSRDSRDFGPLPMGLISGKVIGKMWWPLNYQRMENSLKPVEDISRSQP